MPSKCQNSGFAFNVGETFCLYSGWFELQAKFMASLVQITCICSSSVSFENSFFASFPTESWLPNTMALGLGKILGESDFLFFFRAIFM